MIPEPSGEDPAPVPAHDPSAEIDELSFLVGTACSRTITLLMQPEGDRETLRDELEHLAAKAARLAALLR